MMKKTELRLIALLKCGLIGVPAMLLGAACATATADAAVAPDLELAGMRIGNSPAQVATVVRERRLGAIQQFDKVLTSFDPATGAIEVPNGEYVMRQIVKPRKIGRPAQPAADSAAGTFSIFYTPEPAAEQAAKILRSLSYETADAPAEKTLVAELIRQYGRPAVKQANADASGGGSMLWARFGSAAAPAGAGKLTAAEAAECVNVAVKDSNWYRVLFGATVIEALQHQTAQCGASFLAASWSVINPSAQPRDRVVNEVQFGLFSPALTIKGIEHARELMKAAPVEAAGTAHPPAKPDPGDPREDLSP